MLARATALEELHRLGYDAIAAPRSAKRQHARAEAVLQLLQLHLHGGAGGDAVVLAEQKTFHRVEATQAAQDGWVEYVNAVAGMTLFPTCNSWYLGANVPGKTRVFMPLPGFPSYAEQCASVAANDYQGFVLG